MRRMVCLTCAVIAFSVVANFQGYTGMRVNAQDDPTPIRVQISTSTPLPLPENAIEIQFSPTPSVTVSNIVFLEAISTANVRSAAEPDATVLGVIETGMQYPIVGKYFQWYQFRYDKSPNGRGWAHESVVNIIGEASLIADLTENPEPTTDTVGAAATQTWEAITLTPGIVLTATANARLITGPVPAVGGDNTNNAGGNALESISGQSLPTFTPPPDLVSPVETAVVETTGQSEFTVADPTPSPLVSIPLPSTAGDVAPIVPIVILGGFGLVGLVISSTRR